MHYYNYNDFENLFEDQKIARSKSAVIKQNKFTIKPQGIIITDTYNNPFFPIEYPKIDTSKIDLIEIHKRFRENYLRSKSLMLPWHFMIEMVNDIYVVFNTRPIDMKFPLNNQEAKEWAKDWDPVTELFFKENIFDISEAIHIGIVGNTSLDIYTNKTYSMIGNFCITPIVRQYKLPAALHQRIFGLNLGSKFNLNTITRFIKS